MLKLAEQVVIFFALPPLIGLQFPGQVATGNGSPSETQPAFPLSLNHSNDRISQHPIEPHVIG